MENLRDTLKVRKERAILIAAVLQRSSIDVLAELTSLAQTAGAVVVYKLIQKLNRKHSATYIGKGKAELLAEKVKEHQADVVIFDNDLSPAQIRELEKIIEAKVLDRSELILDIFATRAKTRQALLQVELAQLQYTYPRLTKMWSHLDTVTGAAGGPSAGAVGGIGTRGTGEKQLEIDRRLVSKRITELKRQLESIDKRRLREIDSRQGTFKVSIVGYTNSGKSTLLNILTDADVFAEDKLFATLDTRTRKWILKGACCVLLSDTVGFVRDLPHQLVASFKATLEEAVNADLLLNVIDASNPEALDQIRSVEEVLGEIGCKEKKMIMVFNKVDAIRDISLLETIQTMYPDAVSISARTGLGLEELKDAVTGIYKGSILNIRVQCACGDGKIQSFLRGHANIVNQDYSGDIIIIDASIGKNQLAGLKKLRPDAIEVLKD